MSDIIIKLLMEVLLMKGLLKEEYGKLEEICGVVIHSEQKNINLIIQNALTLFLNQCEKPAIWCYGIHTKMLMADFIFCLKKVRYIIDNGIESKDDNPQPVSAKIPIITTPNNIPSFFLIPHPPYPP